MKIENRRTKIPMTSLEYGDIFYDKAGDLHIRTKKTNAVRLVDGLERTDWNPADKLVYRANAKVICED